MVSHPELPLLEACNLKRELQGRVLWQNISFTVREGEILFVLGPSGIGKTLLLRCLSTLDALQVEPLASDGTVSLSTFHSL
jgi:polar amino acid transport system ATP-binding protein